MPPAHLLHETAQGVQDVGQRLSCARLRKEHDEIDRVPLVQGDADLQLPLEPADARTMSGARVDDHHRRLGRIETIVEAIVADAGDTQQSVVHRLLEAARIEQ